MKEILISVIIPVYNVEKYLNQCLDSIVNQTLKEIEIIVINDASTDNSLQIIHEYSKKYKNIKVIDNKQNEGLYNARNIGLKNAIGKYIGFVDSDDYIEYDMYESLYFKAQETNADIVSCNYNIFYENTKKTKKINFSKSIYLLEKSNNNLIGAEEILFYTSVPWNKIFKKDFLTKNNIMFDSKIKFFYDACFNRICYLNADKIIYIPQFLYTYRKFRKDSIRNKKETKNVYDIFMVSQSLINYVKTNNMERFLPYFNYICTKMIYIVYLQCQEKYRKDFFNNMCTFLENNYITSIKQFYFIKRNFNLISLSYYRYLAVKILNILIIKTLINRNRIIFEFIIKLRNKIVQIFSI